MVCDSRAQRVGPRKSAQDYARLKRMGCCVASGVATVNSPDGRRPNTSSSSDGSGSGEFEFPVGDDNGAPRPGNACSDASTVMKREKMAQLHEQQLVAQCGKACQMPAFAMQRINSRRGSGSSMFTPTLSSERRTSFSGVSTNNTNNSQNDFGAANQTIIIFDWDDTLCPSTVMRKYAQFDTKGRLRVKLDKETETELKLLAEEVKKMLRSAQKMGKVILVTNAKRPWVDISCHNFMPSLKQELAGISVFYAFELLQESGVENFDRAAGCLLTEMKARAMKAAITDFYSRYPNQSWKNILSIGDALFEHAAIRQVVHERPMDKRCRTKTVKLLEGPTVAGMVVQLSIVGSWLLKIVHFDSDIDMDLSAGEATIDGWVRMFESLPEVTV